MVQTVVAAQELYAKAALINQERLAELQQKCRLIEAEELFRSAFWQDVRPIVREWRVSKGFPVEPLKALAESGYIEKITRERASRNSNSVSSYA
jgi:L-rhamnose isomerase/sugar isomerase